MFIDIGLFSISIAAAIGFGWGFNDLQLLISENADVILVSIAVKICVLWYFGIYQQILRFTGWRIFLTTVKAIAVSFGAIIFMTRSLSIGNMPISILINDGIITLLLVIASRLSARLILTEVQWSNDETEDVSRVIIYGAGSAGCLLAHALARENGQQLVGFVDDNLHLHGRNIQGTKVYSPADLLSLKATLGFDHILLAMPSVEGQQKRAIINRVQNLGVPVKTVPGISEILTGDISIDKVREVDIGDLLGRAQIAPDPKLLQHDITDRVVLVTGAGGSIGSEICRQIVKQHPKLLIMYELHEFALYRMDMELGENHPELYKVACLGSVTDAQTFRNVLKEYRVETIYHAAAYKHVPIVEANPLAGMVNNIGGTLTVAKCAVECGVKKFVLISTDKAVRPTNIMGATKRVAELVLQGLSDLPNGTCFTMVRFGNVLGSSGSVIPRFHEQIKSGKPLTVTHGDITRYFMTIPEAATLVIQAGAMAKGGEVFLLDMGEPVRIYDLAAQMIRLHGMEPGKDVKIEITGLRPGEKIYEELLIDCDGASPTGHAKIFCAHEAKLGWYDLEPQLSHLLAAAAKSEVTECVSALHQLVPEYQPMGEYAQIEAELLSV